MRVLVHFAHRLTRPLRLETGRTGYCVPGRALRDNIKEPS